MAYCSLGGYTENNGVITQVLNPLVIDMQSLSTGGFVLSKFLV